MTIGLLAGLVSGFLWGVNNLFLSLGYAYVPGEFLPAMMLGIPLACVAFTDSAAAVSLVLLNAARGLLPQIAQAAKTRSGLVICLAALLGGPVGQTSYVLGISMAGAANALIISSLYPIVGCLLAAFWLKQRVNGRTWCGIFLSVVGSILVGYQPEAGEGGLFYQGIACALIAALCWGSESVIAVYGMKDIMPDAAITIREAVSGAALLLIVLPCIRGYPALEVICRREESFYFFMAAGVVAGLSYMLWYKANHRIGCAKGMATNITYIIWGCLLNFLFGNSAEITGSVIAGCVLVMIGVMLVTVNPRTLFTREKL
ncbi:MAG: DMT family transporter [Dialister sp.]|nr:DMT family transporter [Dialister sp.]